MAKLVDALCSGRSARKGVLVRIQFWALGKKPEINLRLSCFYDKIEDLGLKTHILNVFLSYEN